jgi:nitrous oxidase accessory protein NosD
MYQGIVLRIHCWSEKARGHRWSSSPTVDRDDDDDDDDDDVN